MRFNLRQSFALVLTAVILFFACESQHFTGAKVYIQQNNWDKAIEQLQIETQQNPANAEAWWLLGSSYAKKKMFVPMNQAFDKCLEIDKTPQRQEQITNTQHNEWVPLYNSAVGLMQKSDFAGALEKINTAITINNTKPENWVNKGIIYIQLDSVDLALVEFDKAIEAIDKPVSVTDTSLLFTSLKDKAAILQTKGKTDEAITIFEKITELKPQDALTYIAMGSIYDERKDFEKSRVCYEKAAELEPDNKDVQYNIGVSCFQAKNYECAIQAFERVISISPDDVDALYNLGLLYVMDKKFDAALPHLEKLSELDAENKDVWGLLGTCYVQLGNKEKGAKAFDRAKELEKMNNEE